MNRRPTQPREGSFKERQAQQPVLVGDIGPLLTATTETLGNTELKKGSILMPKNSVMLSVCWPENKKDAAPKNRETLVCAHFLFSSSAPGPSRCNSNNILEECLLGDAH